MTLTYEEPYSLPGKTTEDTDTFEVTFTELVPGKKLQAEPSLRQMTPMQQVNF